MSKTASFSNIILGSELITPSGVVRTTGNQTISGDKTFDGWLTGTRGSLSFKSGIYKDSSSNIAIDFFNRQLKLGAAGIATVDWSNQQLNAQDNTLALNWYGRTLYDSSSAISANWSSRYLTDSSATLSVSWQNRALYNSSANTIIDWNGGYIYDTDNGRNETSIQFTERVLANSLGTVLDWENLVLYNHWDLYDGAASPFLGTDWNSIGDTEVVTKEAVKAGTKKSLSINGLNLVYYGTAGRSVAGSVFSTQPAALCSSGSAHRLIFTIDAAGWAGRTVKLAMIWTNSTGGVSHTIRFNCSIRTTALNGTNNYAYNAGNSNSTPFNEQFTSQVPSATASYLKYSESTSFTIPSNATAITMQVGFESIPSGTAYITEAQLIEV